MPACAKWSAAAEAEFVAYMRSHGQSPMVQAVLRDAQTCKALATIR